MKIYVAEPTSIRAHSDEEPTSIQFVAENDEEQSMILGLIRATEYPGILGKAFSQVVSEVIEALAATRAEQEKKKR